MAFWARADDEHPFLQAASRAASRLRAGFALEPSPARVIREPSGLIRIRAFPFGGRSEPVANFDGILARRRPAGGAAVVHTLDLVHHAHSRVVPLLRTRYGGEAFFAAWRGHCSRLGLPPLEDLNAETRLVRDLETLERPLLDLLREGRIALPPLPPDPPPGVEISHAPHPVALLLADGTRLEFLPDAFHTTGATRPRTVRYEDVTAVLVADRRWGTEAHVAVYRRQAGLAGADHGAAAACGHGLEPSALVWLQNCLLRVVTSGGRMPAALSRLAARAGKHAG